MCPHQRAVKSIMSDFGPFMGVIKSDTSLIKRVLTGQNDRRETLLV